MTRKLKLKDQAFSPKVISVDNEINRCILTLFHIKVSINDYSDFSRGSDGKYLFYQI